MPEAKVFAERYEALLNELKIPKKLRIRPGLIVCQSCNDKNPIYKFLLHTQEIPEGFQPLEGIMNGSIFGESLLNGVIHVNFSSEIEERFGMMVLFHDLGHLAALTDVEYLEAFRRLHPVLLKLTERGKGYSSDAKFFENFQYLPTSAKTDLDQFLSQFKDKNGGILTLNSEEPWNAQIFSAETVQEWKKLEQQRREISYSSKPNLAKLAKIKIQFQDLRKPILGWLEELDLILDNHLYMLGGAFADGLSYRVTNYITNEDYSKIHFLRRALQKELEELESTGYLELEGLGRQGVMPRLQSLIAELIYLANLRPLPEADRLIKEVSRR